MTTRPLRQIRQESLYSQRELSRLSGLSRLTIRRAEEGTVTPELSTIRKLSKVLEVEPAEVAEFARVIREWTR